jgi:hypothetical protein
MERRSIRVALSLLVVCACSRGGPTGPDSLLDSNLTNAPTSTVLAGHTLTLRASLWRDFQPITPPDGKPLVAVLQVNTDNGSAVPSTIRAELVSVIYGTQVWSSVPQEERARVETAPLYEVVARDGPKWAPGVTVDVVVRLRDGNGPASLLRATNQLVRATF